MLTITTKKIGHNKPWKSSTCLPFSHKNEGEKGKLFINKDKEVPTHLKLKEDFTSLIELQC